MMDDLIKALTILRKYGNPDAPTNCETPGQLTVLIYHHNVTDEDKESLEQLGFYAATDGYFKSHRFGLEYSYGT